jgi:hypothetical protein
MVAVFLGQATAFPERTLQKSSLQGADVADVAEELLEPVASLAV